ncbi:MAG: NUDIX hydrolase [Acidobacterium ailaaui]|nr:NUDIX hydrolase [Pseudacidobacterium ailaaui]MDI3253889.1 NUDIX hydrolase [Bacillota bacterium]
MKREYPDAPVIGVAAIILEQEKVLFIQRGKEPLQGEWSLPGGALELGESLAQGVCREVQEETGLEVEPLQVVEVLDRIAHDEAGRVRYHYVLVDFLCRRTGGQLRCASDAVAAVWLSREELAGREKYRITAGTAAVVEKAFQLAQMGP